MSKYGIFCDSYFPAFELNTEIHGVTSVFSSNTGKYRPERTPYLDTFPVVQTRWNKQNYITFTDLKIVVSGVRISFFQPTWNGIITIKEYVIHQNSSHIYQLWTCKCYLGCSFGKIISTWDKNIFTYKQNEKYHTMNSLNLGTFSFGQNLLSSGNHS